MLEFLKSYIVILAIAAVAGGLSIILHEAGHLVGGLMTGYRFLSFRVGSFVVTKDKTGKKHFKRSVLPGTGGQCLMIPCENYKDYKYKLYLISGGLVNIILGFIGVIIAIVCFNRGTGRDIFILFGAINLLLGLMNLIPFDSSSLAISNDGRTMVTLNKSEEARKLTYILLKSNALITMADSYDEIPEVIDEMLSCDVSKGDLGNSMVANMLLNQATVLAVRGEHEKAIKYFKKIAVDDNVFGIFKLEACSELLYYEIIGERRAEKIDKLYNTELRKYIDKSKLIPSKQRVLYAYYKLYKKDEAKAKEYMDMLIKAVDTYAIKADAVHELEVAKSIN